MSGSTFGTLFRITTWGESHGAGIGVVIDGCPAGLPLSEADIQAFSTAANPVRANIQPNVRREIRLKVLSGVFRRGRRPAHRFLFLYGISVRRSRDYGNLAATYRPGHADYTFDAKYGVRDYRGGGRSSGRETIGRVAGGAVASLLLRELGVQLLTLYKSDRTCFASRKRTIILRQYPKTNFICQILTRHKEPPLI